MNQNEYFFINLKTRYEEQELSRVELAERLRVNAAEVWRWLKGLATPKDANMRELEKVLKVSQGDFFLIPDKFNRKYVKRKNHDIKCWDSNKKDYDNFILGLVTSAKNVKLAILCPQADWKKRYRPREMLDTRFRKRLMDNDVEYQIIEVYYSEMRFVNALQDACFFEGKVYETKYFIKPPHVIPTINLRIIDDEHFIFGSFSAGKDSQLKENVWEVDGAHPLSDVLREYWDRLHSNSLTLSPSNDMGSREILDSLGINGTRAASIIHRARSTSYPKQAPTNEDRQRRVKRIKGIG